MHARPLTFASLLLAAASPAVAAPPTAQATQAAANQPDAPLAVTGKWSTEVKDGKLVATLTVVNGGTTPVDVLVARGKAPGASVQAAIAGVSLTPILGPEAMQSLMSRRGPMPVYTVVAANNELLVGTYQFQLPPGYAGEPIDVLAYVGTQLGESVKLETHVNAKSGV